MKLSKYMSVRVKYSLDTKYGSERPNARPEARPAVHHAQCNVFLGLFSSKDHMSRFMQETLMAEIYVCITATWA